MKNNNGKRYSNEEKAAIVKRMMPPNNESVGRLSDELGITEPTLYKWRKETRLAGNPTPGDGQNSEQWSSEDKFLVVMETYSLNGAELVEKRVFIKNKLKHGVILALTQMASNLIKQSN